MKVPYGEGVAIHTDPESCGGVREGMAEESVTAKQVPDTVPDERPRIWTTLNGHKVGNHGHSQGIMPTSGL